MDLRASGWVFRGLGLAVLAASFTVIPPRMGSGPSLQAQEGSIQGRVILSPRIASRRARFRLYSEYGPGSAPGVRQSTNEMVNVVIYLDSSATLPGAGHAPRKQDVRQ